MDRIERLSICMGFIPTYCRDTYQHCTHYNHWTSLVTASPQLEEITIVLDNYKYVVSVSLISGDIVWFKYVKDGVVTSVTDSNFSDEEMKIIDDGIRNFGKGDREDG